MSASKTKTTPAPAYRCGKCGRKLKVGHWVFSRFTRARYCWPGEGCAR